MVCVCLVVGSLGTSEFPILADPDPGLLTVSDL